MYISIYGNYFTIIINFEIIASSQKGTKGPVQPSLSLFHFTILYKSNMAQYKNQPVDISIIHRAISDYAVIFPACVYVCV